MGKAILFTIVLSNSYCILNLRNNHLSDSPSTLPSQEQKAAALTVSLPDSWAGWNNNYDLVRLRTFFPGLSQDRTSAGRSHDVACKLSDRTGLWKTHLGSGSPEELWAHHLWQSGCEGQYTSSRWPRPWAEDRLQMLHSRGWFLCGTGEGMLALAVVRLRKQTHKKHTCWGGEGPS